MIVNQTTKKMKSLDSSTASSEDSNLSAVIDKADLIDHTDSLQKTKEN